MKDGDLAQPPSAMRLATCRARTPRLSVLPTAVCDEAEKPAQDRHSGAAVQGKYSQHRWDSALASERFPSTDANFFAQTRMPRIDEGFWDRNSFPATLHAASNAPAAFSAGVVTATAPVPDMSQTRVDNLLLLSCHFLLLTTRLMRASG